ncbi:MAG: hypothetical protein GC159_23955 [Phycisphaera sp.]|nr:hypothetical protein [Phycisphaera sp.]
MQRHSALTVVTILLATTAIMAAPPTSAGAEQGEGVRAPVVEIVLDDGVRTELHAWVRLAGRIVMDNYPMIVHELGAEGFTPPEKVRILVKQSDEGVAYASGNEITLMSRWFIDSPEDVGAVVHEMCHVVQQYRDGDPPSWVTEGVADYVRWFVYEPANRRPHIDTEHATYTDSYQTTAAFFDWIVHHRNADFVRELNVECRAGRYDDALFEKYAGKPLAELWNDYVAASRTRR